MNKALHCARLAAGLSQTRAAEAAGISLGYWSNLESGRRSNPSRKVDRRIRFVLGVKPTEPLFPDEVLTQKQASA